MGNYLIIFNHSRRSDTGVFGLEMIPLKFSSAGVMSDLDVGSASCPGRSAN